MCSLRLLLRGTIVNKTYGTHKNLPGTYLPIFTNNIWSYFTMAPRCIDTSGRIGLCLQLFRRVSVVFGRLSKTSELLEGGRKPREK